MYINLILIVLKLYFFISEAKMPAKIVGGFVIPIEEAPWQVSLANNVNGHFCGGSIISNSHILTSAHCVSRPYNTAEINLYVKTGSYELTDEYYGRTYDVIFIIIHPKFSNKQVYRHDIAMLKIDGPIIFSNVQQPISLPFRRFVSNNPFVVFSFTGWGYFDQQASHISNYLQKINVIYSKENDCIYKFPGLSENLICTAELPNGQGSAQGDSGGGLIYDNEIIGIVSGSLESMSKTTTPVFTLVYPYLDFIKNIMEKY